MGLDEPLSDREIMDQCLTFLAGEKFHEIVAKILKKSQWKITGDFDEIFVNFAEFSSRTWDYVDSTNMDTPEAITKSHRPE